MLAAKGLIWYIFMYEGNLSAENNKTIAVFHARFIDRMPYFRYSGNEHDAYCIFMWKSRRDSSSV